LWCVQPIFPRAFAVHWACGGVVFIFLYIFLFFPAATTREQRQLIFILYFFAIFYAERGSNTELIVNSK